MPLSRTDTRERQYEHIKESDAESGISPDEAKANRRKS